MHVILERLLRRYFAFMFPSMDALIVPSVESMLEDDGPRGKPISLYEWAKKNGI